MLESMFSPFPEVRFLNIIHPLAREDVTLTGLRGKSYAKCDIPSLFLSIVQSPQLVLWLSYTLCFVSVLVDAD